MHRVHHRVSLIGAVLLVFVLGGGIASKAALADAATSTFSVPSVSQPAWIWGHGDGSFTVADGVCPGYNNDPSSTANSAVTLNSGGTAIDSVKKINNGKMTQACWSWITSGSDGTIYAVQVGTSPSYPYQVVAARDNTILWARSFPDPAGCGGRMAYIYSISLGQDGNLYMQLDWKYLSVSCPEKEALASLDASTGAVRFQNILPSTGRSFLDLSVVTVMPYSDGVAVLNGPTNGFSVYFYEYDGTANSSATWTPTLSGATVKQIKINPDTGRLFLLTQKYVSPSYQYHLYYKDTTSSTVTEIAPPTGAFFGDMFATPSNGVVATWAISTSNRGFSYYNSSGSQVYQKNLATESGAVVVTPMAAGTIVVDDDGNVIARRVIDQTTGDHDRNVIVDSYDPTGTETRLFNSSSMGVSGQESFSSTSYLWQSIGDGQLYMALCHATGSYITACTSSYSPVILAITLTSSYDYMRSAAFGSEISKAEYVALGDSYSSGEGLPDFLPPSDTDNCDRSPYAYSVLLAEMESSLRLKAFRACSGAETGDVSDGMNGESGQLDSLNSNTNVVTITIGGNDIGFGDFAARCVEPLGSCDSSSQEYIDSMDAIANDLPDLLDDMYDAIREHAPNAQVYVVGYPQVAPPTGTECSGFTDSEKVAARDLDLTLNDAIEDAVARADSGFTYVDPNAIGSPFVDHELCTEDPYFLGFNFFEHRFTFHPNAEGQQAYADLIASYL